MLEPYAVKVASTVLRRGGGSNLSFLFGISDRIYMIDRINVHPVNPVRIYYILARVRVGSAQAVEVELI